jgi:hypothetical protein
MDFKEIIENLVKVLEVEAKNIDDEKLSAIG